MLQKLPHILAKVKHFAKICKFLIEFLPFLLLLQTRLYKKHLYTILLNRSEVPANVPKELLKRKYKLLSGGRKTPQLAPYAVWMLKSRRKWSGISKNGIILMFLKNIFIEETYEQEIDPDSVCFVSV